jgi:hypothetical protein
MLRKYLILAVLAALVVGASASPAGADDTFRLDIRRANPALVPGLDDLDETQTVHGWRRGFYGRSFYGGFYRPYYSSFYYRPYYYPRFYGSSFGFAYSRPFYSSFYAPYYNFGYGSFGYGFNYYRPYVYSSFYSSPSFYYSPYYYCPIGDSVPAMPYATGNGPAYTVLTPYRNSSPSYPNETMPYSNGTAPRSNGSAAPEPTYPYNGGPQNPVPMPDARPATPQSAPPRPTVPLEGRAVSLPREQHKYTYPAYGEGRTSFAEDRVLPVTNPSTQRASR